MFTSASPNQSLEQLGLVARSSSAAIAVILQGSRSAVGGCWLFVQLQSAGAGLAFKKGGLTCSSAVLCVLGSSPPTCIVLLQCVCPCNEGASAMEAYIKAPERLITLLVDLKSLIFVVEN
jgi:hypothetical protein